MKRIAAFQKVSYEQFENDWHEYDVDAGEEDIRKIYDAIVLPNRATKHSAGYDFHTPVNITLEPGESVRIPTGVRAKIDEDYVLLLFPRSSLGFKYRLQLNNTVGVIDSDYYGAENEGHIFAKLTNDTRENRTVSLHAGDGFMQGIFLCFGITVDDEADTVRTGGIGSTGK